MNIIKKILIFARYVYPQCMIRVDNSLINGNQFQTRFNLLPATRAIRRVFCQSIITAKTAFLAIAGVGLLCIVVRQRGRFLSREKQIVVIGTLDECEQVLNDLTRKCNEFKLLGVDCEWVTVGSERRPVALLQLSSHKDLLDVLKDDKVIKVCVGTKDDAHVLVYSVASKFDPDFLAALVNQKPEVLKEGQLQYEAIDALAEKQIVVIETPDECERVLDDLKRHCHEYKVLGFDCEWLTVGCKRRPVALLQLSSQKGLCALFRLCNLQQVPKDLRDLLEDDKVIKVGISPQEDAQKLAYDYGVRVARTLDLRFLAALVNQKPEGLAKMAKSLLDVQLDKNLLLSCSDWEAKVLNEKQLQYAANDALVSVRIFEKLVTQLDPRQFWNLNKINFLAVEKRLQPFYGMSFPTDKFIIDNLKTIH